jgi:hypothetical protein
MNVLNEIEIGNVKELFEFVSFRTKIKMRIK